MIARIARAALAAGVLVGILAWGALQVRAVPILLQAEAYEQSAPGAAGHATHAEGTPATDHHNEGWRRHAKTFLTTILTGVGYAFLLVGAIMISSRPVDARSGALWGACGFVAFSAAPALGLPPVLPGMETAELGARQIW
ncbi:MAG: cobalt transporter, partial [Alphaproteobacteria bacterium]|nr:cobalt transporter [Alphaproteobacteria bacterium]